MTREMLIYRSRKVVAYISAIVGIFLFGADFISYFIGPYREFITTNTSHQGWAGAATLSIFAASAVRFTLRLAYVISFAGLLFLRRWSVYLCLIAWLGQLIPSAIYFSLRGHGIGNDHIISFVSLLVYLALAAFYWPILKAGRALLFCGGALASGLLLHIILFALLSNF